MSATLLWFRNDLRLADNTALHAACTAGKPIIPLFIWSPEDDANWPPGAASRWWLHQSLIQLNQSLTSLGSRLIVRKGPVLPTLQAIIKQSSINRIHWNRSYQPALVARDATIKSALRTAGLHVESFNASLLHEPWDIANNSAKPFQVFTPFWKSCLARAEPAPPLPAPQSIPLPSDWPCSLDLTDLALEPTINWTAGLRAAWSPGEAGAKKQLDTFLKSAIADYSAARDIPASPGTSLLSPHLHFGEISPRQIWHAVRNSKPPGKTSTHPHAGRWGDAAATFLREIGWREFAHHLLYHFPHTADRPLRPEYESFPWSTDAALLRAWEQGRTGYPIVDAGLRQLWTTGWMHNRVRMIAASFLVKDLLISWQDGAKWFWDTLVDADVANNTLGWQWTAGCGADAAPFFRIFNPVLQGEKFDPKGHYVRRWIPEIAALPDDCIHRPWTAAPGVLAHAKVTLGRHYPAPIVDHAAARTRALAALARIKKK